MHTTVPVSYLLPPFSLKFSLSVFLFAFLKLRKRLTELNCFAGGSGGLVSMYELAVNPDYEPPVPGDSTSDSHGQTNPDLRSAHHVSSDMHGQSDAALRSANLAASRKPSSKLEKPDSSRCPLALQLVSHIALESYDGMIKPETMANR